MADNATWTPRPSLNVARGGLASATAGGRIHVIGGFTSGFATILASVEAHQPGNDTWELVAPMLTARGNPGAAAVGNRIYAFGGFPTTEENVGTDLAEVFDRSANQWEQISRLPAATTGPGAAAFGGQVFVVGGGTTDGPVDSVHVYNPQTDRWSSDATPMPTARELLKVTELGGRLYAIGGHDGTRFVATVERYTPATDTWETVAPMNTPRGNPGVVSAAGRIFVVGGGGDPPADTSSETFDPNTNIWQQLDAVFPVGLGSLSAERGPGNVILAIGGFEDEGIASARVQALPISQL